MIAITLPAQTKGSPYKECFAVKGTGPFSVVSHNVDGKVTVIGDQVCISIDSPKAAFDAAIEIKGDCFGCKPVTFVAVVGYQVAADKCVCVPVSIGAQNIAVLPETGQQYFASISLSGSGPFELCGGAAPKCLTIELKGNVVQISGRYDGNGAVKFSVKNACTCDCIGMEITQECVSFEQL